jgi:phytoene dehydrogenase-like protein
MPDAVIIGSGPNGLVAANLLAEPGWDVVVLEAQSTPGGSVRTGELTLPGFHHDLFSAFYPLAAASPIFRHLNLAEHGLTWKRAPLVLAHPLSDGRCATLSTDLKQTCDSLEQFAPGDGAGWQDLYGIWERGRAALLDALLTPFPPVVPAVPLGAALRWQQGLRLARIGVLPVRRLGEEQFSGAGGPLLLAGNALHSDLTPETAGSGIFGWLLSCLGQDVGFPVPEGGAGRLTAALVARLEHHGGQVICGQRVTRIAVKGNRAVAAATAAGDDFTARRAVVADVSAPSLYFDLLDPGAVPAGLLDNMKRFQWDASTIKVDWALDRPTPWAAEAARRAGTVHVADDLDNLTEVAAQLAMGVIPARPFLLFGQQAITDPTRSPPGTDTAWAYTHVPRQVKGDAGGDLTGRWDPSELDRFVDRIEARVEPLAPGFRDRILPRVLPRRSASRQRQPGHRGDQQWHRATAPAADLSAQSGTGPGLDTDSRLVPGAGIRPSGRRRPRRPGSQRRSRRLGRGSPAPGGRGLGRERRCGSRRS